MKRWRFVFSALVALTLACLIAVLFADDALAEQMGFIYSTGCVAVMIVFGLTVAD